MRRLEEPEGINHNIRVFIEPQADLIDVIRWRLTLIESSGLQQRPCETVLDTNTNYSKDTEDTVDFECSFSDSAAVMLIAYSDIADDSSYVAFYSTSGAIPGKLNNIKFPVPIIQMYNLLHIKYTIPEMESISECLSVSILRYGVKSSLGRRGPSGSIVRILPPRNCWHSSGS